MKTILVTGGSGLLGKSIQNIVESNQHENWIFVSSKDADLRDYLQVKSLFKKYSPTHILHLAANVGGLYLNMNHKVEMLQHNLAINQNVLKASYEFKVQKVISCLSTCIFPDKCCYPITEDQIHNGPPHESNYGYAYSKRILHTLSK